MTVAANNDQGSNHNSETTKGKKNPLGFIVDFFRPKKPKASHLDHSDNSQRTYNETSGSSESVTNSDNNNSGASRGDYSSANAESSDARLSTPKRQKESEMIISMEKLYVSREDNPLMTRMKSDEYELGEIQPSHSQNVPLGAGRQVLPPTGQDVDLDHSHLIRSPPPTLKRNGSPVQQKWSQERDHGRLEEDAAAILALQHSGSSQLSNYSYPVPLSASKSLSPISNKVCQYYCTLSGEEIDVHFKGLKTIV